MVIKLDAIKIYEIAESGNTVYKDYDTHDKLKWVVGRIVARGCKLFSKGGR